MGTKKLYAVSRSSTLKPRLALEERTRTCGARLYRLRRFEDGSHAIFKVLQCFLALFILKSFRHIQILNT